MFGEVTRLDELLALVENEDVEIELRNSSILVDGFLGRVPHPLLHYRIRIRARSAW